MKNTVLSGHEQKSIDMGEKVDSGSVPPLQPVKKTDRVEVVKVLVLAIVSFVLGFGLVIFFLGPSGDSSGDDLDLGGEMAPPDDDKPPAEEIAGGEEAAPSGGYAPGNEGNPLLADNAAAEDGDEAAGNDAMDEGDAPVEVPPGRTPDGVGLKGDGFYLKCWDDAGSEVPGTSCDKLRVLEKRFSTRLYVVDKCKQQHAGAKAEGKLSLGLEVDFDQNSLSFWNGASSDLENAAKVATCLRTELAGLPMHSVDHKYSRYRLFFTVVFGKVDALSDSPSKKEASSGGADKPAVKGKTRKVMMDRVRVRQTPVDGDVIGKISTGNQVTLVGRKGEWCEVITPNENRGWMICEALSK